VVVSDGYVGNITLKAIEGVGSFASKTFKKTMLSGPFSIIGSIFAFMALKKMKRKLDPRMYNGGVFLGLNGICVKSHGGSDALGFSTAVKLAIQMAQYNYVQTVIDDMNALMDQETLLVQGLHQV
ncbi:MAG: phosphate acyltransferase, partial [Pseudomonadota bacterium]